MIYAFQLESMTEDELALLYYIFEKWTSRNIQFAQSLDRNIVARKIQEILPTLTESAQEIANSLYSKLKIENDILICEE